MTHPYQNLKVGKASLSLGTINLPNGFTPHDEHTPGPPAPDPSPVSISSTSFGPSKLTNPPNTLRQSLLWSKLTTTDFYGRIQPDDEVSEYRNSYVSDQTYVGARKLNPPPASPTFNPPTLNFTPTFRTSDLFNRLDEQNKARRTISSGTYQIRTNERICMTPTSLQPFAISQKQKTVVTVPSINLIENAPTEYQQRINIAPEPVTTPHKVLLQANIFDHTGYSPGTVTPYSARSEYIEETFEQVYPADLTTSLFDTDSLTITARQLENLHPDAIPATIRFNEGLQFLERVYSAATRSARPLDHTAWIDSLSKYLSKDMEESLFDQAVNKKLKLIRDYYLGRLDSVSFKRNSVQSEKDPQITAAQNWLNLVDKIKPPGKLSAAAKGKGNFSRLLNLDKSPEENDPQATFQRDVDCFLAENCHGGTNKFEVWNENVEIRNCCSSQIIVDGTCKQVKILNCENCLVTVNNVNGHITVEASSQIQFKITGNVKSVLYV